MNYLEKKEPTAYEIKQIILKDGTILDVDKIVHVAVVKEKETKKCKEIHYDWKITYFGKNKNDLLALSNQCSMLAHVFKFMREYDIDFDKACIMYDEMIEAGRKLLKDRKKGT
jgi:hypothetical protein